MAQSIKSIVCRHKDFSLIPSAHVNSQSWWHEPVSPVLCCAGTEMQTLQLNDKSQVGDLQVSMRNLFQNKMWIAPKEHLHTHTPTHAQCACKPSCTDEPTQV